MSRKISKKGDQHSVKTTGHEWDGIQELDNPDPAWLRVVFYIALFFSILYWILFPSWPVPGERGLLEWSSVSEVKHDLDAIQKLRNEYQKSFDNASFTEIMKDASLLKFGMHGGKSAFENNCVVCHGNAGAGGPGYPNLRAGAWLWGGDLDSIYRSISYGIRSAHDDTRLSEMAAFGKDKILKKDEIELLAKYVMTLSADVNSNNESDRVGLGSRKGESYNRAKKLFLNNCALCHGEDGKGKYEFGAPNLSDNIWLYGGSYDDIHHSIFYGRAGVMPYWSEKLTDSTIRQLTLYVHQLGGGE